MVLETILLLDNPEVCTSINQSVTVICKNHNKTYYYMILKHLLRYSVKILNKIDTIVTKVLPNTFVFSVLFLSHTLYVPIWITIYSYFFFYLLPFSRLIHETVQLSIQLLVVLATKCKCWKLLKQNAMEKRGLIKFLIKEQINGELKYVDLISVLGLKLKAKLLANHIMDAIC